MLCYECKSSIGNDWFFSEGDIYTHIICPKCYGK